MQAVRASHAVSSRRGAVLVLMTVLFPVVLVICLFSVNVADMALMRTELRVSTDAAGGSFLHARDPETLEEVFRKLAAMSVLLTD